MKTLFDTLTAAARHPLCRPLVAIVVVLAAAVLIAPEIAIGLPLVLGQVLTEGRHAGEFVLSEANGSLSRETVTVTVAATTTLPPGMVMGRITASGKYVPYNNAAVDGSDVAAGVLYAEIKNAGGAPADFKGAIVARLAEVRLADLNWNAQAQAAIDAGVIDLATKYVITRG